MLLCKMKYYWPTVLIKVKLKPSLLSAQTGKAKDQAGTTLAWTTWRWQGQGRNTYGEPDNVPVAQKQARTAILKVPEAQKHARTVKVSAQLLRSVVQQAFL